MSKSGFIVRLVASAMIVSVLIFCGFYVWQAEELISGICYVISALAVCCAFFVCCWFSIIKQRKYLKSVCYRYDKKEKQKVCLGKINLKRHRISTTTIIATLCYIIALACALIPTSDRSWNSFPNDFFNVLELFRKAMQAMVVDGGIADFFPKGAIIYASVYRCYTGFLCMFAGIYVIYGVIKIFSSEVLAYWAYWLYPSLRSRFCVISELNEKSIALAESIWYEYLKKGKSKSAKMKRKDREDVLSKRPPKIYFCDTYQTDTEEMSELMSRAWQLGAITFKRDISEMKIKRNSEIFLIGNNEEENITQAQIICARTDKRRSLVKKWIDGIKVKSKKSLLNVSIRRLEKKIEKESDNKKKQKALNKKDKLNRKLIELETTGKDTSKGTIYIYASRMESELLIDDMHKTYDRESSFKLRRIDEHYRFALDFFWKEGAKFFDSIQYSESDKDVKVLRVGFFGFGDYAQEFLKVLCCLGQLPRCRLIVYIFDKEASDKKSKLQKELLEHCVNPQEKVALIPYDTEEEGEERRFIKFENVKETAEEELKNFKYHENPFYELHFVECDVEQNQVMDICVDKKFTHMFFVLGNDAANINAATKVSTLYAREDLKSKFYAMVKSSEISMQLKSEKGEFGTEYKNVQLIGANIDRFSYTAVKERELEILGLKTHREYCLNYALYKIFCDLDNKIRTEKNDRLNKIYKTMKTSLELEWGKQPSEKFIENAPNFTKDPILYVYEPDKQLLLDKIYNELGLNKIPDEGKIIYKELCTLYDKINRKLVEDLRESLEKTFVDSYAVEGFNSKEYYRRSSKSRILFERMLFELGYLYLEKDCVKAKNLVSEFDVKDEGFKLKTCSDNADALVDPAYSPKNIASYSVNDNYKKLEGASQSAYEKIIVITESAENEEKKRRDENPNSEKIYKKITPHIDNQWFEVNNILQKRWMVSKWGEGFIRQKDKTENEAGDKESEPHKDLGAKTHKYLKPYIEIYADDEMRMRYTVDVLIKGMADTDSSKEQKSNDSANEQKKS